MLVGGVIPRLNDRDTLLAEFLEFSENDLAKASMTTSDNIHLRIVDCSQQAARNGITIVAVTTVCPSQLVSWATSRIVVSLFKCCIQNKEFDSSETSGLSR